MRRTKPAQIHKKTGNLRAVQLLLGHTKLESTVRYLGIEVEDALSISEQVELRADKKLRPCPVRQGRNPSSPVKRLDPSEQPANFGRTAQFDPERPFLPLVAYDLSVCIL
jgi:hypothetical protein